MGSSATSSAVLAGSAGLPAWRLTFLDSPWLPVSSGFTFRLGRFSPVCGDLGVGSLFCGVRGSMVSSAWLLAKRQQYFLYFFSARWYLLGTSFRIATRQKANVPGPFVVPKEPAESAESLNVGSSDESRGVTGVSCTGRACADLSASTLAKLASNMSSLSFTLRPNVREPALGALVSREWSLGDADAEASKA